MNKFCLKIIKPYWRHTQEESTARLLHLLSVRTKQQCTCVCLCVFRFFVQQQIAFFEGICESLGSVARKSMCNELHACEIINRLELPEALKPSQAVGAALYSPTIPQMNCMHATLTPGSFCQWSLLCCWCACVCPYMHMRVYIVCMFVNACCLFLSSTFLQVRQACSLSLSPLCQSEAHWSPS
jgi:hypothetical protein